MKLHSISVILGAAIFSLPAPSAAETCAPAKLVRIVVANVTPGVAATSFAAQPKTYYRIGSDKLRVEEALDAANGIQETVVISEPNIWVANLYDRTGKHIVDPGPTLFARAPVFGSDLKGNLIRLEFGCEADFIASNAPKPVRSEQVAGTQYNVYRVNDDSDAIEILERPGSGTPVFARYYQQGSLVMILHYNLYQTGLPNDPSLFVPPANVRYTDSGQQ